MPVRPKLGTSEQRHSPGMSQRISERAIVGRVGREREVDVVKNLVRTSVSQLIDELCLDPTRPGPIAKFTKCLVIDANHHDLAARRTLVEAVTADAEPVFGDLAEADQP